MAIDRYKNQTRIIDNDKLSKTRFVVVGAGAIGTAFLVALCKMGAKLVTLYDFDTIEDHNFANQMHPVSMLGRPKVDSLAHACLDYGDCKITTINGPWTPGNAVDADVVVSCVDNMDVREALWKYYKGRCEFFLDGRMSAFVYKVYGVDTELYKDGERSIGAFYESTLHSQADASPEPCGEKSIIYTVYFVAGMMLSQVREFLTPEAQPYRATEIVYDALNHTIRKTSHQPEVKMNIIQSEEEDGKAEGSPPEEAGIVLA